MYKHLNLPRFIEVRKGTGANHGCLGLFAKEPIERGTKLFTREIHTVGISGKTLNDVRSVCHHCLEEVGNSPAAVCKECRISSYCSRECLDAARPLHVLECKGMKSLESLRGKVKLDVPKPSSWLHDYEHCWPPAHALLAAHVINKGILKEDQDASGWINFVKCPRTLPPIKARVFAQLEEHVRLLVPEDVTTEQIKHTLRAISINAGTVISLCDTIIVAVYNVEYLLLNHVCKPNCEIKEESKANEPVVVYTIDDIEAGEQLGISYVTKEYYINVREVRRAKLSECFGLDCDCFMCQGETIPGSKLWLLEKQKSSLIAPWSHAMARQMMVKGWELLCECDSVKKKSLTQVIEILAPALETHKQILDQRNVIIILMAVTLLLTYCQMGESRKAVDVYYHSLGKVGLMSLMEYGTRTNVAEITGNICIRLLDLEWMVEFNEMFKVTQQIHPRRPSCKALCEILHLNPDMQDTLSAEEWELDDEISKECQIRADQLGVPREFYERHAREFLGHFNGQPTVPDLLQACQDMLAFGHNF